MSYSIRPINQSKQQTKPRQEPEGWLGWGARNTIAGLASPVKSGIEALNAYNSIGNNANKVFGSNIGHSEQQQIEIPKYIQPKDGPEQFLQGLIGAVGLTGAAGGIKAAGQGLLQQGGSVAKGIGKAAANYAASYAGSAAGEGLSDLTGASKIPYIGKGIKAAASLGGAIAGPAFGKQLLPSKIKENLKKIETAKYKKAESNSRATTNQKELRKALTEGLELEHEVDLPRSESNRKNLEGSLNKFRTDTENVNSSIHKPQILSNYDLNRAIKSPNKVDVNRNIILDDLFPGKKLVNKDATLNSTNLKSLYKDEIKLNELFKFNKKFNNLNYINGRKASPSLKNAGRVTQEGIERAGIKHPYEVQNFRDANEIHKLLLKPNTDNMKLAEQAFHYLVKGSKYLGIGKIFESIHLNYKSFKHAAPETRQFIVNNMMQTMEKYPGIFHSEISNINKIVGQEPKKKQSQSKPTSGFSIRPIK